MTQTNNISKNIIIQKIFYFSKFTWQQIIIIYKIIIVKIWSLDNKLWAYNKMDLKQHFLLFVFAKVGRDYVPPNYKIEIPIIGYLHYNGGLTWCKKLLGFHLLYFALPWCVCITLLFFF